MITRKEAISSNAENEGNQPVVPNCPTAGDVVIIRSDDDYFCRRVSRVLEEGILEFDNTDEPPTRVKMDKNCEVVKKK